MDSAADVVAFVHETMGAEIKIHHMPELASWTVQARRLGWIAAGTSEWGTERRHAGELIADALNSRVPQIFDIIKDGDSERRVLNVVDTEAAKEKLTRIKTAFQTWIWSDPDRTDRLARVYNDRFNNIAPRSFNGDHLNLPGASTLYFADTRSAASGASSQPADVSPMPLVPARPHRAAVMEQKRLGLIAKAMMVVPGPASRSSRVSRAPSTPHLTLMKPTSPAAASFPARAATTNWMRSSSPTGVPVHRRARPSSSR